MPDVKFFDCRRQILNCEIKMIISYHFSNFDPRSFPSQSGIPKDVPSHVELEFWKNINRHCLQAPRGDPPPHLLDLGPLGSHISGQSWPRELQVVPFNSARRAESNETHLGSVRNLIVKRVLSLLFLNLQMRAIHAGTFWVAVSNPGNPQTWFWVRSNRLDELNRTAPMSSLWDTWFTSGVPICVSILSNLNLMWQKRKKSEAVLWGCLWCHQTHPGLILILSMRPMGLTKTIFYIVCQNCEL